MIKLAILGEIGSGNLGDDLGYLLLKEELEGCFRRYGYHVTTDWITPSRFSQLDYMGYQAVILGCGTLLDKAEGIYVQKIRQMQLRGTPTAILGSGVSDSRHAPQTTDGKALYDKVIKESMYTFLRGEKPDVFWLLGSRTSSEPRKGIGINIGFAAYSNPPLPEVWNRIHQIELWAISEAIPVYYVSCWTSDNIWFADKEIIQISEDEDSIQKLLGLRALVSFRGHLSVAAACCGVTTFPIIYSEKVDAMFTATQVKVYPLTPGSDGGWLPIVRGHWQEAATNESAVDTARQTVQFEIEHFVKKYLGKE